MAELPRVSGDAAIKAPQRLGFMVARQRGSHVVLRRGERGCVLPRHRELAAGTLRSVLRQAGVSVEDFVAADRRQD